MHFTVLIRLNWFKIFRNSIILFVSQTAISTSATVIFGYPSGETAFVTQWYIGVYTTTSIVACCTYIFMTVDNPKDPYLHALTSTILGILYGFGFLSIVLGVSFILSSWLLNVLSSFLTVVVMIVGVEFGIRIAARKHTSVM